MTCTCCCCFSDVIVFAGVDREFERLLCDIFGSDFVASFKSKYPVGWVDLMIAFESRKRAANPRKTNPLNVALPFTFIHYYKKFRRVTHFLCFNVTFELE